MSSIVIKIGSLVIKSLSKPIATQIKQQAREHERFRGYCISIAQRIHRWDMRFRLGLLQDQAAIDKQIAQEAAERAAEKHKHKRPTARTEAQAKADEEAAGKAKEKPKDKPKEEPRKRPKIRPLTEAKAIDSGANFVSETFLLVVAVACVVGERYYSSKKESSRREDVADRLEELEQYEKAARKGLVEMEREIIRLRAKAGEAAIKPGRILPREVYELEEKELDEVEPPKGLFARIANYINWPKDEAKVENVIEKPKEKPSAPSATTQRPSSIINKMVQPTPFVFSDPENPRSTTSTKAPEVGGSSHPPAADSSSKPKA